MFSGLFGGGGSAKRASAVAADAQLDAGNLIKAEAARLGEYHTPYRTAGDTAAGGQNALLGGIGSRISALDPKIAALYQQQAALQPQVSEMYGLSKQQDPVIQEILGGGQNFTADPGYQFRLEEGQKALERSRAAGGVFNSGQTGKALLEYGQNMGSQEYGNYMARLQDRLGAINTQLGGRSTALNAGQNQVAGGINLLGQDFNQITAQQNLANQYQALINSGMSAADAAARLGMDAATKQGQRIADAGQIRASGQMEKARQMAAAGDQWLNLGGAVVGGLVGGPIGAKVGGSLFDTADSVNNPFSAQGQQVQSQPYGQPMQQQQQQSFLGGIGQSFQQGFNQGYNGPQVGVGMPQSANTYYGTGQPAPQWQNPDVQKAAQISTQSSYRPQQRYYS